jgi:hypothetical protein
MHWPCFPFEAGHPFIDNLCASALLGHFPEQALSVDREALRQIGKESYPVRDGHARRHGRIELYEHAPQAFLLDGNKNQILSIKKLETARQNKDVARLHVHVEDAFFQGIPQEP